MTSEQSTIIDNVLTRGVVSVLPNRDQLKKLLLNKKIKVYQGFDPSMPSLHLGNLVGIMKLRQFQKLGHKVIFLIGDFTGMIGDPTDKLAARKKLSRDEVLKNAEIWKNQIQNLLDFEGENPAEIRFNSSWNDTVNFRELLEITSNFTVQQMIERDMYQDRLKNNKPIYLHEFLYPVAQAYDSVAMDVDLEIGGSDQLFNMLAGRQLMKAVKGKNKFVLGTGLLTDKEGKKVGKTTGNALFLNSSPEEFYAGIMSFPDEVIYSAFELLTESDLNGLKNKIDNDPMQEKKRLAFEIINLIWGISAAKISQICFEKTFQDKEPVFEEFRIGKSKYICDFIAKAANKSKSEIKRLLNQQAIDKNGVTVIDMLETINDGDKIKIGKRMFIRAVL